jgi:invasion protein IalB
VHKITGILAALLMAVPAFGATKAPPPVGDMPDAATAPALTNDGWSVVCRQGQCAMIENVMAANSGAVVARLQVLRANGADVLLLRLPFNVLLDPGAALGLDNAKPQVFAFDTCDSNGCVVIVPFTPALRAQMLKAGTPRILVGDLSGTAHAIPFSMNGFADASRTFDREGKAQHGAATPGGNPAELTPYAH